MPAGGGRDIHLALNEVQFSILPLARKGSVKAVFIITDGNWNTGGQPKKAADSLKKKGVKMFVIGVGKKVTYESLKNLASRDGDKKYWFAVENFNDLENVRKSLVRNKNVGK